MANFFRLVKIELLSLFGINKAIKSNDKKEKKKVTVFLFIMLISTGSLVFVSSIMNIAMANVFNEVGGPTAVGQLPAVMYPMLFLLILIMAMHNVNGVLFGFRDYDILMSMPIKNSSIILAKLFFMYLIDLASTMTILIPCYILYGWFNNLGVTFYVVNSLLLFVLPLLPLAVSLVFGTIISYISARLKHRNIVEIITTIIFLALIFSINALGNKEIAAIGSFSAKNFLSKCYVKASCFLDWRYIVGIIAVSIAVMVLVFVVLNKFYKKINSAFMSKASGKNYVLKDNGTTSAFKAVFKNEVKRYFGIPIYVINTLVSGLMGIAITVIAIVGQELPEGSGSIYGLIVGEFKTLTGDLKKVVAIFILLPILIGAICATSPTTSSSVSLEGKTFWIMKTSPVKAKTFVTAKLLLDYIIFVPITLVAEIILCVFVKMPFYLSVFVCITGVALSLYSGALGLIVNIKNPLLEWETEAKPIKQSISVVYTMLFNWVGSIGLGIVLYVLYSLVSFSVAIYVTCLLSVILAMIFIIILYTKYVKVFEKITK